MFGPLPRVYRLVVVTVVVVLGLAGSLLVGWYLPTEVVATSAAAVGLLLGIALALFLVQSPPAQSRSRQTSRRTQRD
ncbi:MAG: hypothetical protein Q8O61_17355 [Nocardioides sp.]|nr:hypothetical protein [Nocardioides sp.]